MNSTPFRLQSTGIAGTQSGVTLIEVLVALVIVAIGLLGLAGLQVRGLSIQKDAHGRAIATQLALDLADRMRANRDPVARVPPADYTFTDAYQTGTAATTNAPVNCAVAICSLAEQAQYDLRGSADSPGWLDRVGTALPGGWARIEPVAASGGQVWDIRVMWVETGFRARAAATGDAATLAALGTNCPAGTPAQVECQTVRVRP